MNTDRELLKLAAKASGLYVVREVINHNDEFIGFRVKPSKNSGREMMVFWNALEDDGDALRLAVRLGLQIFPDDLRDCTVALVQDNDDRIACAEKYDDDGLTATRRAIVRAAAAIGKSMP